MDQIARSRQDLSSNSLEVVGMSFSWLYVMDPFVLVLGWAATPLTTGILLRVFSWLIRGRF